jgi:hypothetical protein
MSNPLVLFTGSRNWPFYLPVFEVVQRLQELLGPYTLMHGAARGLDTFAGIAAKISGLEELPIPAQWNDFGKAAGVMRNTVMLRKKPILVVAFWDGRSTGTLDTITKAVNVYRIPTVIYRG